MIKEGLMKKSACLFIFLFCFAGGPLTLAQHPASPASAPALQTLSQIMDSSVSQVERGVVEAADAMPESKYSFVPASGEFKTVRTFALQVKHVAVTNYVMASAILREKPPVELESVNGPASMTSKADIMAFLKGSFAFLHRAASSLNEKNATEQVPNPEGAGTVPKLDIATRQLWHDMDHYR